MNWEYKRITVSDFACRDEDHEARLLNELGAAGWELVSVVRHASANEHFLKRPLVEAAKVEEAPAKTLRAPDGSVLTPYDGRGCPVDPWSAVVIMLKNGGISRAEARGFRWDWPLDNPRDHDIIGYRVLE